MSKSVSVFGWFAVGAAGGMALAAVSGWLWLCFGTDYDLEIYP